MPANATGVGAVRARVARIEDQCGADPRSGIFRGFVLVPGPPPRAGAVWRFSGSSEVAIELFSELAPAWEGAGAGGRGGGAASWGALAG